MEKSQKGVRERMGHIRRAGKQENIYNHRVEKCSIGKSGHKEFQSKIKG